MSKATTKKKPDSSHILICKTDLPKDKDEVFITNKDEDLINTLKEFLKTEMAGKEIFSVQDNVAYTEEGTYMAVYSDAVRKVGEEITEEEWE